MTTERNVNPEHIGSSLDELLHTDGTLGEATRVAHERVQANPEPAPRPTHAGFIWNGFTWNYAAGNGVTAVHKHHERGYYAAVTQDGVQMIGANCENIDQAAAEALRMADYVATYRCERDHKVRVHVQASRRVRPAR